MKYWWRAAAAVGLGSAAAILLGHPAHAAAHRAGLVIEHAGGRVLVRCITFVEDQLSGFQLIQRSGISYRGQSFGSFGEAICQLDGEPAAVPANCFGSGPAWQYFHRVDARWVPSQVGASGSTIHDGDLDGWQFGSGSNVTLPTLTLAQVCAPPPPPAPSPITTPRSAAVPTPASSSTATASPLVVVLPPTPTSTPTAKPAPASPAGGPLGVLSGSLLILAGLTAWNLWRRGP